jgi:MoxR-like ATPase
MATPIVNEAERTLDYTRTYFDPDAPRDHRAPADGAPPKYVYQEPIILAVNVALATGRALLVAGPPGSGKTTLARHIAWVKGWRYIEKVVTSKTQVDDLIEQFDTLERLNDATTPGRVLLPDAAYVNPGVLWWAFDRDSASRRGMTRAQYEGLTTRQRAAFRPPKDPTLIPGGDDVVLLLDEIDKADPDVPNDILEPLDRRSFTSRDGQPVAANGNVLMVITTNGERDLPPAFVRRCVLLTLGEVRRRRLIEIAKTHFEGDSPLYDRVARVVRRLARHAHARGMREPSTAEFIDTIRACRELDAERATQKQIAALALAKERELNSSDLLDRLFDDETDDEQDEDDKDESAA